ncbi:MAG: thioredoxin [Polyangiaceae bacterium]
MDRRYVVAAFAVLQLVVGCKSEGESGPGQQGRRPTSLRIVSAPPEGEVATLVQAAAAKAKGEGRTLLVYTGAVWCDPCRRFHEAATRGALGPELDGITLLEFDLDRDADRLRAAGYTSKYIPLFARPASDGRSTGKQIEGSIKGDGAVKEISPRLATLVKSE